MAARKKVSNGSRLMVCLPLDMLMQVAWSWTAFANSASRQGQIRAASSLAGLIFVSNPYPKASLKSVRTWMAQVLRLGCWRRETERSKGGKQGAEGSSGATEPSCQRKQDVAESFSSRNEHAQSRASSRGVGGAVAARSACWFRRISGHAGTVKSGPGKMINHTQISFVVLPFVPPLTELDYFHGKTYVSIVGFQFLGTGSSASAFRCTVTSRRST